MGTSMSSGDKIQPSELNDLKKGFGRTNSDASDDFKTKTRSTTDICFLILMATFFTVLLCFVGYCVFNGDIYRIINGYDNCGKVCGRNNDQTFGISCQTPHNNGRMHIVVRSQSTGNTERYCVDDCKAYPGYRKFFNRCIPERNKTVVNTFFSKTGLKNFFQEVSEDFHFCWREIIYLCLIALALSIGILLLFRFLVGFVVWFVLTGTVLACTCGTIFLWMLWNTSRKEPSPDNQISDIDSRKTLTYFSFAIAATIATIIILLIIIIMRKRIQLVVQLFEESGKAVISMPLLLFEPILTFLSLGIVVSIWFYFSLWIESSGELTEKRPQVYYFEKDMWMKLTRWINLIGVLWMVQFVIGCQHMIIAGAVSTWFFTRDKSQLKSPILKSASNLMRYHLGSVALGSLIIAVVQFLRILLKMVEKYLNKYKGKSINCLLKCCHCCLYCFETVIKYLSRNAYIEVAMYGLSFCPAGKQAFKQLSSNVLRVAAINSVGDFILFLGKVFVVLATVLIGIKLLEGKQGIQHLWVPLTLAGLFAYFISHCFMTVYEMTIDTIFLCFCEDCEQNDGITKEYFMSRGLMEFVENSKKALEVHDSKKEKRVSAWQEDLPTISATVGTT